ncbi:U-box domain-containing protein 40 [Abeliophyllum distichum]|uniref:RING-type E3 ubiquitin transferase n=1 Tax=Abeliophyllum distichum TaxID=126358 RepID=A0ABD1SGZ5_9LAMI
MGGGKQSWKISFHRSPSTLLLPKKQSPPPKEFLCPISDSLMADPVVVSSGHTFERNCIRACVSLSFKPTLSDGSKPDFSTIIPNLALKSTILNCPSCYSSSSSSDVETLNSLEEEEFIIKLKSSQVFEQEEGLISLRKLTRTKEETRVHLCTPRLLSAIKSLISSRYSALQVNAVAALVNLSLEKRNKVKIVRSGIVPLLIDILKGGFPESQDHAAGALFSLALDDHNKTAIGVLGALPLLLHALRSDSERIRHDSALALYHLSLVQSNQVKMIKLGSVQNLLEMVKSRHMTGRVLLVLCNLAASAEGRAAMLDGGAVECFVNMLSQDEFDSAATRESCLAALYGLSYGGLRFKGLAKEAGAEETLEKVEKTGSERAKKKASRMLEVLRKEEEEEEEEIDWEKLLESEDDLSRMQCRLSGGAASNSC